MAWTTPTNIVSGADLDSGKFNSETVANLLHLYGALPRVIQADISGGPTSGTTELLLTGTVTIPAQAVDMLVVPSVTARITGSVSGDYYQLSIRSTNVSGTIRGFGRNNVGAGTTNSKTIDSGLGEAFALASGAGHVLVATLVRVDGTGTGTLTTGSNGCLLTAMLFPDL